MENLVGKFIGPHKIKEVKLVDRKTYLGKDVLEMTYEDGTKEELTQKMAEKVATEKETDFTTLRDNFVKSIIEEISAILLESEIKIIDIEYVLQSITGHLNQKIEEAIDKAIGKDKYTRSLVDINKILTQKNDTRNKTKDIKPQHDSGSGVGQKGKRNKRRKGKQAV
jgi:hypothetical protein